MRRKAQGDDIDILKTTVAVMLLVMIIMIVEILKAGSTVSAASGVAYIKHLSDTNADLYVLLSSTAGPCDNSIGELIGMAKAANNYNVEISCPPGGTVTKNARAYIVDGLDRLKEINGNSGEELTIEGLLPVSLGNTLGELVTQASVEVPVPGSSPVTVTLEGYG